MLPAVDLSSPAEARLPRTWISLLRRHLRASLAATTGVEGPEDVVKYLLAGERAGYVRALHAANVARSPW